VLVTYAATGRTPFAADSPEATVGSILTQPPNLHGLTPPMCDLVEAALPKDPAQRPSAATLLDTLLRGGEPTARLTLAEKPELYRAALAAAAAAARHSRHRRWRRRAVAAAAALALLGGSTAVTVHFGTAARAAATQSRRQAVLSASQTLTARATSVVDSDPGLSLRLAMAAQALAPSDAARAAVTGALATRYQTEPGTTQPTWHAAYRPDGKVIATAGANGSVDLWGVGPGNQTTHAASLSLGPEVTMNVAFSPDGTTLATIGDGVVALRDQRTRGSAPGSVRSLGRVR